MPASLDELTAKAVRFVEIVSRQAVLAATVVLAIVAGVVTATTVLGALVLSGPVRSLFLMLAVVFGAIAIGAAWLGRWRLGVSGRKLPQLSGELRELLAADPRARSVVDLELSEGEIIDAYVVNDPRDPGTPGDDVIVAETRPLSPRPAGRSWFDNGRGLLGLRSLAGDGISKFGAIASVVAGARTYPLLAFWALLITLGFAGVGAVLLLVGLVQLIA